MSRPAFVLLPPSESKVSGGRLPTATGYFDESLATAREQVRAALASLLRDASPEEVSRVLKVRGALLERAVASSRLIVEGVAPTLPAWQRYSGVVWSHLEPLTLSEEQRSRVLIPSGLYGLSTGTDEIADYRLTMKVNLGDLGNVASFWRPTLARALEGIDGATFVNLLPKEHDGAMRLATLQQERILTVSFLRHGGEGIAGHDAKAVKGVVARRVLDEGLEAVDGFRWKGWRGRIHRGHHEVRAPRGDHSQ